MNKLSHLHCLLQPRLITKKKSEIFFLLFFHDNLKMKAKHCHNPGVAKIFTEKTFALLPLAVHRLFYYNGKNEQLL